MAVSTGRSFAISGIDAFPVTVEVDVRKGLPSYSTVGLPDKSVAESQNRVQPAIKNSGFEFPVKKITVNLAPADRKKEGTALDFPIALGILASTGVVDRKKLKEYVCIGELSLDGHLRRVCGVLPIALKMRAAGFKKLLLPAVNAREAAVVPEIETFPAETLGEAAAFINGQKKLSPVKSEAEKEFTGPVRYGVDFSDIKGQYLAKRAFEIAAAGGHNIIMVGPPGAGKTMLAKRLVTILPPLSLEEAIEVTVIQSVAGRLKPGRVLFPFRPFRSPHHTISDIALVGGGSIPRPGEISLAHRGVLFLDEFPEFKRKVIEVLRQPLEDGEITVSRAIESVTYPSRFMLVAAMNPCPCGYNGVYDAECLCSPLQIRRYHSRISGPMLDRIDMHIEVPRVKRSELDSMERGETSARIRSRVTAARTAQFERFRKESKIFCNSDLGPRALEKYCRLDSRAKELLSNAVDSFGLSARGYGKVIKVSRTIADIEGAAEIDETHVAEALQYRFNESEVF